MGVLNDYILILVLLWIAVMVFCIKEIQATQQSGGYDKKIVIIQILLFLGVIIRSVYLTYPYGNFPDESIAGYDAWCIANYGVDQHLASYPVYLQSWGSGQSAVYAYLAVPFVKLFGLSIEALRLPMVIVSSISLLFFYYALRKTQQDKSLIFAIILVFVISPWHIMKSRWALDCNLCPEFVLIGVGFILLAIHAIGSRKQLAYYVVAFAFFILGAYSYGAGWFMLPLFCLILLIYLLRRKYITWQISAIVVFISLILATPLLLFAYQLISGDEQYSIGSITITQLATGRHESTTFLTADDPLSVFWSFIKKGMKLLITGNDKLQWNSIPLWGQFYNLLGLPFIIYTFFYFAKSKKLCILDSIFLIWLITTLPMMIMVDPNVNHWNLLWFPLLYFMARGIALIAGKRMIYSVFIYTFFFCLFIGFCFKYFTYYNTYEWRGFVRGQEEPVKFAYTLDVDSIYHPDFFIQAHILFYHPINPYIYSATRDMSDPRGSQVARFGKNRFYAPKEINIQSRTAYIIPNRLLGSFNSEGVHVQRYSIYSVVWKE